MSLDRMFWNWRICDNCGIQYDPVFFYDIHSSIQRVSVCPRCDWTWYSCGGAEAEEMIPIVEEQEVKSGFRLCICSQCGLGFWKLYNGNECDETFYERDMICRVCYHGWEYTSEEVWKLQGNIPIVGEKDE